MRCRDLNNFTSRLSLRPAEAVVILSNMFDICRCHPEKLGHDPVDEAELWRAEHTACL